jgi:hypothetical protein
MNVRKSKCLRDVGAVILLVVPGILLLGAWAGTMKFLLGNPTFTIPNTSNVQLREPPSPNSTPVSSQPKPEAIASPTTITPSPQSNQTEAGSSDVLEELKDLRSKIEELSKSNSNLQTKIDQMEASDNKMSDLVLASLGSLVAVAVIIPAVNAISQAIANRDVISKIRNEIIGELKEDFEQQIGEISAYLLLKDYETENSSVDQDIRGIPLNDITDQTGILISTWLFGSEINPSLVKDKIRKIPASKLRQLKLHRYPLILRDISKSLRTQRRLYSYKFLPPEKLDLLVEQQLKLFLSLLMLMTYASDDREIYVLPRLSQAQLNDFRNTFEDLHEYFRKIRSESECNKIIKKIREILSSNDIKRGFNFSGSVLK